MLYESVVNENADKSPVYLNCKQRSAQWHQARLGIPTGSQLHRVVSLSGKTCSSAATAYMAELLAEYIRRSPLEDKFVSKAMERGIRLEDEARYQYFLQTEHLMEEVGGIFLDENRNVLVSPDGINRELQRGIEIKCPKMETHIRYCLEGCVPDKYVVQVHAGIWVTGFDSWDFVSYCPEYTPAPLLILPVVKDEDILEKIDTQVRQFSLRLEAFKRAVDEKMQLRGYDGFTSAAQYLVDEPF